MNLVRNALLLRRTSQRWSVRANINFRPWQQVAKGCGSKRNRKRDAGERGSSCCCCASLYLCVICQFTQILLALLDWNAKSNANLLRVRASWQPLPSPPPPSLRCPLAWVSVNGYSYGFTSARHPWTCHGHGQDIMFAPHIFCLPFARIYINRAPSRWLSFPSPPLPPPHPLSDWGCAARLPRCQLSIVFAHRQRICRDVQLAAHEIGLETAWWISRNFKDATLP